MYSRRDFGKMALASVPLARAIGAVRSRRGDRGADL